MSRAALNKTAPSIYPPAQATPTYPLPHHTNQTPGWPYPRMMSQMTPWVMDFPIGSGGVTTTKIIEGTPASFTTLQKTASAQDPQRRRVH